MIKMKVMKCLKIKKHRLELLIVVAVLSLIAWGCSFVINNVYIEQEDPETGEQVFYVRAGEVATFKFDGRIEIDGSTTNETFIIAFLAPTSWNIGENATVTFRENRYEPDVDHRMTRIPDTTSPASHPGMSWGQALQSKYGVMSNVLTDMEWVAFQSDNYASVDGNIDYTVTIKCIAGINNLKFKPAFFMGHSNHGAGTNTNEYDVVEGECFEVVEGNGATIDYCSFHYNSVTPLLSLQDDYITFTFLSDVSTNELTNCDEIYWSANAHTDAGNIYAAPKTQMKKQSGDLPRYDVTIWPAGFFKIPEGETITYIDYYFTNSDGTLSVSQSDDSRNNGGEDIPDDVNEPFSFELRCD